MNENVDTLLSKNNLRTLLKPPQALARIRSLSNDAWEFSTILLHIYQFYCAARGLFLSEKDYI